MNRHDPEGGPVAPLAEVRNLTVRFPDVVAAALEDVSLAVYPGEFVLVAGPSGSGKSTLALALGGYLAHRYGSAVTGEIRVAGRDARTTPLPALAESVALVQQSPESQLCTLVVGDEVAFGLENREHPPAEIADRVDWALGVVGARHLVERKLVTLSGGEQQRVAIAAAIAGRPRLLILDEPTASLDPRGTAEVLESLVRMRDQSGLAVVVVEHRLRRLQPVATRIVRLESGRIVADRPADAEPTELSGAKERGRWKSVANDGVGARAGGIGTFLGGPAIAATVGAPEEPAIAAAGLRIERAGRAVLTGVSFGVRPGELVALMGANGSGKTSLLLSLLGLLRPAGGRLRVLGHDVAREPVSRLARDVGFVFQNPDHQLFTTNVWEEATFAGRNLGLVEADFAPRLRDLLANSGLAERLDDHPQRLSHGQKRRLNVISVVGHAPRLLLLDEPLVGQDDANAHILLELLEDLRRFGFTVVAAIHQLEVARDWCDRVLFLKDGRLVVDAPPSEAFARLAALGEPDYLPDDWVFERRPNSPASRDDTAPATTHRHETSYRGAPCPQ